jgi:hypothetical protein
MSVAKLTLMIVFSCGMAVGFLAEQEGQSLQTMQLGIERIQ